MLLVDAPHAAKQVWLENGGSPATWEDSREAFAEIDLDLNRTEEDITVEEKTTLRAMLLCFALSNAKIGYCQAMNFIGLMLLRVTDSHLHAYSIMIALGRQVS